MPLMGCLHGKRGATPCIFVISSDILLREMPAGLTNAPSGWRFCRDGVTALLCSYTCSSADPCGSADGTSAWALCLCTFPGLPHCKSSLSMAALQGCACVALPVPCCRQGLPGPGCRLSKRNRVASPCSPLPVRFPFFSRKGQGQGSASSGADPAQCRASSGSPEGSK